MSFSVFDRGEGRFDLMRADAEIGWIADRAVGFGGFEAAAATHGAAAFEAHMLAAQTLEKKLVGDDDAAINR